MVGRRRSRLFLSAAAGTLLLASCSLFGPHPYPDYLAGMVLRIDLSPQIAEVLQSAVSARYEIASVATPNGERVLLLIDPAVAEPTDSSPTPRLLIFNGSLDYLGTVVPESPLGYVGRPYIFAADGNILSGDTVFDPTSGAAAEFSPLSPSGLTGFGFSTSGAAPTTYVLSLPPGELSSTHLVLSTYDAGWSAPIDHDFAIADSTTIGDKSYTLAGVRLEDDGDTTTIMVRETTNNRFSVAQASLSSIVDGTAVPLLSGTITSTIDGIDGVAYLTQNDIIVRRTTGSFERYTADGSSMTSSVTSDRRTGIVYGFSTDGAYLYRLDPATGAFALLRTWWQ